MGLTVRRRVFVEEYLRCWNASEAARRAGYKSRADVIGAKLLVVDSIQAAIQARLAELKMGADEVLQRLADHARGSMADFVHVGEGGGGLDLGKAAAAGKLHLVKKVTFGEKSDSLELYDAQAALALLGKAHGLFRDEVKHTGSITIELDV